MLSRLQARRATSGQSRNEKSLFRQTRTSLKRLRVAGDREFRARQSRIGLDEGLGHIVGLDRDRLVQLDEIRGDFHRRARLAHRFEIGVRRKPGTGPVAIPFMKDQPSGSASGRARCRQWRGRAAAPAPGSKTGSPARIAAIAHAPRRQTAARRIADRPRARTRAHAPPRKKTATRTAPGHRNRTGRAHSAGGLAAGRSCANATMAKMKRNQGNGGGLRRLTDTTTEHWTPPLMRPGTKRKLGLGQRFRKP